MLDLGTGKYSRMVVQGGLRRLRLYISGSPKINVHECHNMIFVKLAILGGDNRMNRQDFYIFFLLYLLGEKLQYIKKRGQRCRKFFH
jgi:hypothetical protein